MRSQLASQVADVDVEDAIPWIECATEYFRDQTLAGDDCADRLDEASHDFILDRGEFKRCAFQEDLPAGRLTGDSWDPGQDALNYCSTPGREGGGANGRSSRIV